MIVYENRLLADDSHETSYLNFSKIAFLFRKLRNMSKNWSSSAVVIGALRVSFYQTNGISHKAIHDKDSILMSLRL